MLFTNQMLLYINAARFHLPKNRPSYEV